MDSISVRDCGALVTVLAGACERSYDQALVGSNLAEFGLSEDIYKGRTVSHPPIGLYLLPGRSHLNAKTSAVLWSHKLIAEQVPPRATINPTIADRGSEVITRDDLVLISRFGVATWGHWLCELLPKIVLLEQRFPGRYTFLLPYHIAVADRNLWTPHLASLAYYGIGPDRIFRQKDDGFYQIENLLCVSSIWHDHMMHPTAVEALRQPQHGDDVPKNHRRVAFLRTETPTRRISNVEDVRRALVELNVQSYEVGKLDFHDQVQLFRGAGTIISVLGSGLAGLVYAPEKVGVLSLAPTNFGDRFFYALMQNRKASYIDMRGPITEPNDKFYHWAAFEIDPVLLRKYLSSNLLCPSIGGAQVPKPDL